VIMAMLGEQLDELPPLAGQSPITAGKLGDVEQKYLSASPEVKERLSRTIERGPLGALLKKVTGFKCQVCEALGLDPIGFRKPNGDPYVEAHHAMPVSKRQIGSLAASNVMILCANHHRQMHYGGIEAQIGPTTFDFTIGGTPIKVPRLSIEKG
jgi:hypothetical protein